MLNNLTCYLKLKIFSFKVYNYSNCEEMYTINLDLWKYGMSRDESICIYTNQVFEIQIFLNTYIRYRVDPNTDGLKSDSSEIRASHSSVFNYWMFGIRMILDIFLHPISQLFIRISNVFQNWNPLAVVWTFFCNQTTVDHYSINLNN